MRECVWVCVGGYCYFTVLSTLFFIPSWELKLVKLAGWDGRQLLEGDSVTSGSRPWHKSWPLPKQRGWRVTVCLGHHHRKMSGAKRDTYPNAPPLPFHPLGALQIDFPFEVKAVWYVQFKPTWLPGWLWNRYAGLNFSGLFKAQGRQHSGLYQAMIFKECAAYTSVPSELSKGKVHKIPRRSTTKTVCTHKDRNLHMHSFSTDF